MSAAPPPAPPSATRFSLAGEARSWKAERESGGLYYVSLLKYCALGSTGCWVAQLTPRDGKSAARDVRLERDVAERLGLYADGTNRGAITLGKAVIRVKRTRELVDREKARHVFVIEEIELVAQGHEEERDLRERAAEAAVDDWIEEWKEGTPPQTPPTQTAAAAAQPPPSEHFIRISSLNPYVRPVGRLVGRVTGVAPLSKTKTGAACFSFTLECAGERVRVSAFGKPASEAAAKLAKLASDGSAIVALSRFGVANVDARYRLPGSSTPFEVRLVENTLVETIVGSTNKTLLKHVGELSYNFVSLVSLEKRSGDNPAATFDVAAILCQASDAREVKSKSGGGETTSVRDLTLGDDSGVSIGLTLWGERASDTASLSFEPGSLYVIRSATLSRRNGLSLSLSRASTISSDPADAPREVSRLLDWWQQHGPRWAIELRPLTVKPEDATAVFRSFYEQRKDASLDGVAVMNFATLVAIKCEKPEDWSRVVCEVCSRAVVKASSGAEWHCERCSRATTTPKKELIFRITLADASASIFATLFRHDQCMALLGQVGGTPETAVESLAADGAKALSQGLHTRIGEQFFVKTRMRHVKPTFENPRERLETSVLLFEPIAYEAACKTLEQLVLAEEASKSLVKKVRV